MHEFPTPLTDRLTAATGIGKTQAAGQSWQDRMAAATSSAVCGTNRLVPGVEVR